MGSVARTHSRNRDAARSASVPGSRVAGCRVTWRAAEGGRQAVLCCRDAPDASSTPLHIAELDELAGVHHGDAVAEATHNAEVVADEQQADALLVPQSRQQAQDLRLDCHVKRRGRFVENQQRRFTRQSRGDQRPLLHAAAELMRKGAGNVLGAMDAPSRAAALPRGVPLRLHSAPRCRTIGSAIWRPTRSAGLSAVNGSWNTEPILRPSTPRRSLRDRRKRSRPSNRISPGDPSAVGRENPGSRRQCCFCRSPNSPTMPSASPRCRLNDTSRTAAWSASRP